MNAAQGSDRQSHSSGEETRSILVRGLRGGFARSNHRGRSAPSSAEFPPAEVLRVRPGAYRDTVCEVSSGVRFEQDGTIKGLVVFAPWTDEESRIDTLVLRGGRDWKNERMPVKYMRKEYMKTGEDTMKIQAVETPKNKICSKCKRVVSRIFQKGQCAECLAPSLSRSSKFVTMMRQEIFK